MAKHGPFSKYTEVSGDFGTFGVPAGMILDDTNGKLYDAPETASLVDAPVPQPDLPESEAPSVDEITEAPVLGSDAPEAGEATDIPSITLPPEE